MPVKVYVTQMLVRHLNIKPEVTVDARSLGALLDKVDSEYEGFKDSVCDETGRIRVYVNIFVNGQNISTDHEPMSTRLADGDEVHILANVAGGVA